MAFQSFDYKLHGEGFIQKQVVPTKCDISTFLLYTFPIITKKKPMLNTCFSDAPSGSAYWHFVGMLYIQIVCFFVLITLSYSEFKSGLGNSVDITVNKWFVLHLQERDVRYLLCPAGVCVGHLKKFVRVKFDIPPKYKVSW